MKKLTVNCGDWHLGWGYGGNDKIGKLTLDPMFNTFIWKGKSQGRHGQIWNRGAWVIFTYLDGKITVINSKGGYPVTPELINGAEKILRNQMIK